MASYHFSDVPLARILHITDSHLFGEPHQVLLGINTAESFQAIVQAIIGQTAFDYDFILATGDLVQDHNREAYHRFAKMVKPLTHMGTRPVFWLEGNHDIQPQMGHILATYAHFQPERHILVGEHWQVILLNSQVENAVYGALAQGELDFLRKKLTAYPDRFSLIAMHHNILPTHAAWLDQHSLKNADALAEVLHDFPKAKVIMHGHIHQEVDAEWQGYRILATPSTCFQFKPHVNEFTLDSVPQGWREIELFATGEVRTRVRRLAQGMLPDFGELGY